jgi:hypothetical protein
LSVKLLTVEGVDICELVSKLMLLLGFLNFSPSYLDLALTMLAGSPVMVVFWGIGRRDLGFSSILIMASSN